MLPSDFSSWTRDDWKLFEEIKEIALRPTELELKQIEIENENVKQLLIESKIKAVWISKPETLTKEWMLAMMESLDARKLLWEDLEKYLEWQVELYGSLEAVFEFLVLTYL